MNEITVDALHLNKYKYLQAATGLKLKSHITTTIYPWNACCFAKRIFQYIDDKPLYFWQFFNTVNIYIYVNCNANMLLFGCFKAKGNRPFVARQKIFYPNSTEIETLKNVDVCLFICMHFKQVVEMVDDWIYTTITKKYHRNQCELHEIEQLKIKWERQNIDQINNEKIRLPAK